MFAIMLCLGPKQSTVLKSENLIMKRKKYSRRKPLIRKSKLASSLQKTQDDLQSQCSFHKSQNVRKLSFSLENFDSLSLQEKSDTSHEKVNYLHIAHCILATFYLH